MKITKTIAFLAAVVLLLSATVPTTALAASARHHEQEVVCVISLFVVDPGTDDVRPDGEDSTIVNSGQMTEGGIECFDDSTGEPVAALTGMVSTTHGSTVSWNSETGAFEGWLSGGFSLVNIDGESHEGMLRGSVSGTAIVVPPGSIDGFPDAQVIPMSEFIRGTLKLRTDNSVFKARFGIFLAGAGFGLGELAGSATGISRSHDE